MKITDSIVYVGVNDREIDLFESQYVVPEGVSYNSYLIFDEKVCLMDTVDARKKDEWLENVKNALDGRKIDYLVVSHMEPDHASCIQAICELYPEITVVGNAKTFTIYNRFNTLDLSERQLVVADGDTLSLGKHSLTFVFAPMVHWPEVMVSYDSYDKVLFSADGFGKFGALDADEDWTCEARRYYFNIVGKYGAQVQALLKKAAALDIEIICPLHGPILTEDLGFYIDKYNTWSSYQPEDKGVFIAYASIHGNTAAAAKQFAEMLKAAGEEKVAIADLSRDDIAECVEDAFRYDRVVLAAASYDGGVFAPMEDFLTHLKSKGYRNRKIALIENGSWGPTAARTMKNHLEAMKDITIIDPVVTIPSTAKFETLEQLKELAEIVVKA